MLMDPFYPEQSKSCLELLGQVKEEAKEYTPLMPAHRRLDSDERVMLQSSPNSRFFCTGESTGDSSDSTAGCLFSSTAAHFGDVRAD